VLSATFSNISAISLVTSFSGGRRTTDHGQTTGKLYDLLLRVKFNLFPYLQSRARTHAVLVIDLYEQ